MKLYAAVRFIIAVALASAPLSAVALKITTPALPQNAFGIEFPQPSQKFYCRDARKITHISLQKYITTQSLLVSEVTIDFAESPLQLRIYAMQEIKPETFGTPSTISDKYKALKGTVLKVASATPGSDARDVIAQTVLKTYPQTTHAKTIEFLVSDVSEIEEFYDAITFYYLRERQDLQYFGSTESKNATVKDEENFLGIRKPCPEDDWDKAFKANKVKRIADKITVSGLSGLLFKFGVSSKSEDAETQTATKN